MESLDERIENLKVRVLAAIAEDVPGIVEEAVAITNLAGGMLCVPDWVAALVGGDESAADALLDYALEVM